MEWLYQDCVITAPITPLAIIVNIVLLVAMEMQQMGDRDVRHATAMDIKMLMQEYVTRRQGVASAKTIPKVMIVHYARKDIMAIPVMVGIATTTVSPNN